jgi:hypothetical protein
MKQGAIGIFFLARTFIAHRDSLFELGLLLKGLFSFYLLSTT